MRFWLGLALTWTLAGCDPVTPVSGTVRIIDGDTLLLDGQSVRLSGIDAPELDQRCGDRACGRDARAFLSDAVAGRAVTCRGSERDRYGRTIATCAVGETELGALMVRAGHAVAYRRYSTAYLGEESAAHAAGLGVWGAESFEMPWDHRAARRAGLAGTSDYTRIR